MTPQITDEEHKALAAICLFYKEFFESIIRHADPTGDRVREFFPGIFNSVAFAESFIARCPIPIEEKPEEPTDKVIATLLGIFPGKIAYLGKVEEFHEAELNTETAFFGSRNYEIVPHPNNQPEPRPSAFAIITPGEEVWEINFGPDLDGNLVSDICQLAILRD